MLIICDFAEVINNKLYMQGGGIDRVMADVPASFSMALLLLVAWNDTNTPINVEISLEHEDGGTGGYVVIGAPATEGFRIRGSMEVGRPPGSKPGTTFMAKMTLRLPPLMFPEGGYVWKMSVNGVETERAPLHAVKGQVLG